MTAAYLLYGENTSAKDQKILAIKDQVLTAPDAPRFDYDVWQGKKLAAADLKESLMALPAVAKRRLIIIRMVDKLTPQNKDILLDMVSSRPEHAVVIMDTDQSDIRAAFFNKLKPHCEFVDCRVGSKQNVFDMTRAMSSGRTSEALKIFHGLLEAGDHPLQVMGGLVWFWGKQRGRLAGDKFKKGLLELQEADLDIKRSRLRPEYAVERCVVKLCLLVS